ncbi:hypothetical protein VE03_02040 [Pseudogymnoascus sp. 23342-1-I1]|nr:hypothetical protein VE03_02040 [Pseudogymnoascus sp. 23342-1-I1]
MPIPAPAGALPAAFRVLCMRCLRAKARGIEAHECVWSPTTLKCEYCTSQHAGCVPLPWYLGEEYQALLDIETSTNPSPAAITAAAAEANRVALVAAQSVPKFSSSAELGIYEELRATRAAIEAGFAAIEEGFAAIEAGFAQVQSLLILLQTDEKRVPALFEEVV